MLLRIGGYSLDYYDNVAQLEESLVTQKQIFEDSLILNPVENIPSPHILKPCASFLHGLYNTDSTRSSEDKITTKIQFSGRDQITRDVNNIYHLWAELLGGQEVSMRLLSGLHAHIVVFMAISEIGQRVMALPEKAGGHVSSYAILKRLGLQVEEIPYDCSKMCVNQDACISKVETFKPDIILVDRSEGLTYEDFTWLGEYQPSHECYKIFDASQYLTNILCHHYKNPFDMGFDLILSTMHKNLPGPQRAFVCSKKNDSMWKKLRSGISTYVSNMHVFSIYSAGLMLNDLDWLHYLSEHMLKNAMCLEQELKLRDVPVVCRTVTEQAPPTHHCWINLNSREKAFDFYLALEHLNIMTNYRLLPYDLGYGLRLGLSGATQSGLKPENIPALADIIAEAYRFGYSERLNAHAHHLIQEIKRQGHIKNVT